MNKAFEEKTKINPVLPLTYGLAAALVITCNNPFSMLRFRLQTMPELLRQGELSTPYKGLMDCAKRILKEESIFGFWKGYGSVLLRFFPSELFNFFLKESFSKFYFTNKYTKNGSKFLLNTLSGISSGFAIITLLYPLDYGRLKMTNNIKGDNKKLFKTILKTFRAEGLKGLYRGVLMSYFGMTVFRGTFFGLFDTFKHSTQNQTQKVILSYFSTMTALLMVSPLQTIIRRMMMTSGHHFKYKGYVDCFKQIWKNEGTKGFSRGVSLIPIESLTIGVMFCLFDKIFTETKKSNENIDQI